MNQRNIRLLRVDYIEVKIYCNRPLYEIISPLSSIEYKEI